MLRKVTSIVLLMLMMVVIVTSHASIRYCLCENVLLLENTGKCPLVQCQPTTSAAASSCECCCADSLEKLPLNDAEVLEDCSDCMLDLSFVLGDCVLSSSPDIIVSSSHERKIDTSHSATAYSCLIDNTDVLDFQAPVRGSPVAVEIGKLYTQPLFIRYSVWLI